MRAKLNRDSVKKRTSKQKPSETKKKISGGGPFRSSHRQNNNTKWFYNFIGCDCWALDELMLVYVDFCGVEQLQHSLGHLVVGLLANRGKTDCKRWTKKRGEDERKKERSKQPKQKKVKKKKNKVIFSQPKKFGWISEREKSRQTQAVCFDGGPATMHGLECSIFRCCCCFFVFKWLSNELFIIYAFCGGYRSRPRPLRSGSSSTIVFQDVMCL